jgi:exosortase/archaeosortase family protein
VFVVNKIKAFTKTDLGRVALFVLITFFFHKMWWLFYADFNQVYLINTAQNFLANNIFNWSFFIDKQILGLNVEINQAERILLFQDHSFIQISKSCSGLKQFYQIIVLFILFPGPRKHKLWFIPLSLLVMHLTNLFRIVFLSLVIVWNFGNWDFMHSWIMRPFFYVVIFLLWLIWVEKIVQSDA